MTKVVHLYTFYQQKSIVLVIIFFSVNLDNTVGACGFLPVYPFTSNAFPVRLVKVDENTGELIRDKDGLCVRCKPGEYGEMVGKIVRGSPLKDFVGYVSNNDTNKKLIKDVFNKGDVAFSSGTTEI